MGSKFLTAVVSGLVLAGIALVGVAIVKMSPLLQDLSLKDTDGMTFTAVFLTNDQVYFGRVINNTSQILALEDVYYLKTNADITTANQSEEPLQSTAANVRLLLVKLGSELHRPTNRIEINWEQILFTEEMSGEGPIMEAIKADKKE